MFLSKNLISSFFSEFKLFSDKEVYDIFNSIGIELESIFNFEKTNNLIVGQIKELVKHPNADTLNICMVNIGTSKMNKIICGAINVAVGQKVIVALKGSRLFNGKIIEYKEIRGIKSEGMLCAYGELTSRSTFMNTQEKDDIIVLPNSAKVGSKKPLDIIGFNDKIFEISIPSNRNDLNSIFGIIFEIKSFLNKKKNFNFNNINKISKSSFNLKSTLSSNHFLVEIKNDNFKKSNWIVKSFLMNSGITPSNSIEDISKLNQILCGIPLMVFSNIKGKNLEIVKLIKPINIELKSYGKVSLKEGDIVLKCNKNIIALMNIDVVKEYAIDENSKNIFFLAALLNPLDIRKTASHLKIMNDMTKYSSKNISSWWYKKSLDVFIENLRPNFKSIFINFKYFENKPVKIKLDFKKVSKLLGIKLEKEKIIKILKSFDYNVKSSFIESPIYRLDVENDHDLIEDILKVIGIQNIPETQVTNSITYIRDNSADDFLSNIYTLLVGRGFYLIKNYNLTSKINNDKFNYFLYKKPIKILNPISSEKEYMRLSLIEGILSCYGYNSSLKNELVPIFEIQDIYFNKNHRKHLVAAMASDMNLNNFTKSKIKNDIFIFKNIIEHIGMILNQKITFKKEINNSWGCPKDSLSIFVKEKNIGYITMINPTESKFFKIKSNNIYAMEIDITDLLNKDHNFIKYLDSLNNKHIIKRELSILMPKNYDLNNFYKLVRTNKLINEISIIDSFEKEDLISYSIRFDLISDENNIKDNFQKVLRFFRENNFKINE